MTEKMSNQHHKVETGNPTLESFHTEDFMDNYYYDENKKVFVCIKCNLKVKRCKCRHNFLKKHSKEHEEEHRKKTSWVCVCGRHNKINSHKKHHMYIPHYQPEDNEYNNWIKVVIGALVIVMIVWFLTKSNIITINTPK